MLTRVLCNIVRLQKQRNPNGVKLSRPREKKKDMRIFPRKVISFSFCYCMYLIDCWIWYYKHYVWSYYTDKDIPIWYRIALSWHRWCSFQGRWESRLDLCFLPLCLAVLAHVMPWMAQRVSVLLSALCIATMRSFQTCPKCHSYPWVPLKYFNAKPEWRCLVSPLPERGRCSEIPPHPRIPHLLMNNLALY